MKSRKDLIFLFRVGTFEKSPEPCFMPFTRRLTSGAEVHLYILLLIFGDIEECVPLI